jgi:hypothetical protein
MADSGQMTHWEAPEKRDGNQVSGLPKTDSRLQRLIHLCMSREITWAIPWDTLPAYDLLGMKVKINIRIETSIQHERSRTPCPSYSSMRSQRGPHPIARAGH